MTPIPDCDLCEAARITPWHAEDEVCWVADCAVCRVPMVVWRTHSPDPDVQARAHMRELVGAVADARFGAGAWVFDDHMRLIPDHFHAHARPTSRW